MGRWAASLGVYAAVGASAGTAAYFLWGSLWLHPEPWFSAAEATRHLLSGAIGTALGLAVSGLTPIMTRNFRWARTLQGELLPQVRTLPPGLIVPLAVLAALGEELTFRSLLQPWAGLWASSLLFGLVHQIPGPARWIWATWAGTMGLCLGLLFEATGSVVGPILAHAIVNAMNFRYLRHSEPPVATRTPLGGILGSAAQR
jgi:uncharacterized protein